jgi:3',5'-cyclic AMP phosphodiesterase CpdA
VPSRILHVSDLHFGARDAHTDWDPEAALQELVERIEPAVVVVSGDLTHRGRGAQHDDAAAFLRKLARPLVVVPGNHDIPYTFPARFTHPWREFDSRWETSEPVHASPELHIVGLNSVRPWRHQSGRVRDSELERAGQRLRGAEPGALRVVTLHHQLATPPWRTRKAPVARRGALLERLAGFGAELIVSGHVHQASAAERHEFEVMNDRARGVVVTTAPGLGRPRPNRRGEARGALVYESDERELRVETHVWTHAQWALTADRTFPRTPNA